MKKHLITLILLVVGGVSLMAQLPPDKQAIEQQYGQERQAGSQNSAPKDPNAPYPITQELPFKTGIITDCDSGFSAADAHIFSCWQGMINGAKVVVYTGAEGDSGDPQQGLVVIQVIPGYPKDVINTRIPTPMKAGPVNISAAKGNTLTLVAGHYVLTFDVNAQTFTSIVLDSTPPLINGMPVAGCKLWPANQRLVQVATVIASDDTMVDPSTFKVVVTSNQPIGPNDPMYPDSVITATSSGAYTIQLRADRLGTVNADRLYTIAATASDIVGNVVNVTAMCTVPHDLGN